MSRLQGIVWSCGIGCVVLFATAAAAQEDEETTIDQAKWSAAYLKVANKLEVNAGDLGDGSLKQRPIFSWGNPVREGRTAGDFFIWFASGRPVLVGTIFSYDWPTQDPSQRSISVELHGLTEHALRVSHSSVIRWTAPADSGDAHQLEGVSPPRHTRTQRLVEMRQIAKRVEASIELLGQDHRLRLLASPLYRFELPERIGEDEQVLDGAVFAMVTGTDPELLLIVEALRVQGNRFAWHLTPARFTDLPLTVEVDGQRMLQAASPRDDALYFHQHALHVVPTRLGAEADAAIGD